MREPKFNDYFPLSEYKERIEKVRAKMLEDGMDAILLTVQQNIDYSSGFLHGTWHLGFGEGKQQVFIIADRDEPILLAPDGIMGCYATSAISDIQIISGTSYNNNFNIDKANLDMIVKIAKENKLTKAKIGIENNPYELMGVSEPFFKALVEEMPNVDWVDCTDLMYEVRKIKSPLELEKIRFASKITCEAIEVGLSSIKEGMSERELASIISVEMAKRSRESFVNQPWFIFVYADGKSPIGWDGIPSSYKFKKGDCIYIDTGLRYHGYSADMIRVASIGEPMEEKARIYYGARDANMKLINYMNPGMKCSHLYEFLTDTISSMGFEKEIKAMKEYGFAYEGHGIGLSVHEPPVINSTNDATIEAGMAMSIEGNIFDKVPLSAMTVALKNEENVIVNEDGCEWLSKVSNDIWVSK